MSTKPNVSLARWADTGGADRTTPNSGERDVGFQEGDPADQSIVNELIYQLYQWALYVSDGVFTGDVTIAGDLTVGGQIITVASATFTADSTTDRFTATGIDLHTGDGPLRVSNTGGALPAGLVAGKDYWAVRIDANTFQLAVSFSGAMRGLVVDITGNGTGTQSVVGNTPTRVQDATVKRNLTVHGAQQLDNDLTVGGVALTFPSTVFLANATFDEIAVDNHGLQSGDGPFTVSNSGGALPVPLVAATPYYAIRVNDYKFKLANSRAEALDAFPINLTSNGTGTNSIVGSSPTRVANASITGDLTAGRVLALVNAGWPIAGPGWALQSGSGTLSIGRWSFTGNGVITARLSVPVGTNLTKIRFAYDRGGGANIVQCYIGSVNILTLDGGEQSVNTDAASSAPTTVDVTTFGQDPTFHNFDGSAGSHVIRADSLYWVSFVVTRSSGTITLLGAVVNP